jgi:DNA-directed RNA polymerase specialized sigma24 family protein
MKIRYEFATGETSEVEVSEELGRAFAEMTRRATLKDRAETRRHVSLERLLEMGMPLADGTDIGALAEWALDKAALIRAMDWLEPHQRDLVRKVYFKGISIARIAHAEGVLPATVSHRLERIYRKLQKFLE